VTVPATTTYGVELLVELAIGRAADAGLWGTSRWEQARWGTSDTTSGDWLDVTCDVLDDLRLTAGSNVGDGVTRRWESASAAFTLDGTQWDPWNGPHVGIIGDRTPVRISWRASSSVLDRLDRFGVPVAPRAAGWVAAFTGYIATRGYRWDPGAVQAQVQCVDGTSILVASNRVASSPAGAGETAAARVTRVAAAALWPGGFDVTAGGTALQATTLEDPAWDELLDVADTDLALMWINRAGVLAYRPRGRVGVGVRLSGRLVVCESAPDDVAVMTMGRNQPSVSRNRVTIARRKDDTVVGDVPVPAVREDRESIARYQSHDFKRTDLWHVADAWSTTLAEAVLGAGAWPSPAPGQVLLDSITGDPLVPVLLLTLEPDMTFDVVDDGGTATRQAAIGWDVQVRNTELEGVVYLEDVSIWTNVGHWGTALWGVDRWGIGGI
jgi:hypothetical protein